MTKYASIFKLVRIVRGKTIEGIANELTVTPSHIRSIECGKKEPSPRILREYAKALNLSEEILVWFMQEEGKFSRARRLALWALQKICDASGRE